MTQSISTDDDVLLFDGVEQRELDSGHTLSDQGPVINGPGDVVFTRYDFSVGPGWLSQIVGFMDGDVDYLTDSKRMPNNPSINDAGDVVWQDAESGIVLWVSGSSKHLLDSFYFFPHISNRGRIACSRWNPAESTFTAAVLDGELLFHVTPPDDPSWSTAVNTRGEATLRHGPPALSSGVSVLTNPVFLSDLDLDGDADLLDFARLQNCVGSMPVSMACACSTADVDPDSDVTLSDFERFLERFQGP